MKLHVELSPKSIQEAIKKLQFAKKQMKGNMMKDFLEDVCMWIIKKANMHLDNSDIGEDVKLIIRNAWQFTIEENGAKLINNANVEKIIGGETQTIPIAVLVEFGVGIVGQSSSHPNASEEGYEYNKPSRYKNRDNSWIFSVDSDINIDIQTKYIDNRTEHTVRTKGSPAVMYLYNAVEDARNDLQNPNGELAQKRKALEEKYIERYIG